MWVRRGLAALACRVCSPGPAGPGGHGLGEGRPTAVAGGAGCERSSALAPSAESSARITPPPAGIGRKRPAPVASCNNDPGRSGVRPSGRRTIFDGPGPRRPPSGVAGLESAGYQPGHRLQPTRRTTGESARRRRRPLNPHQAFVMALLGRRAWTLPRRLERIVPEVDIEGERLAKGLSASPSPS